MPKLFERPGYVCKLNHCVYGLCQATLNFFLTLKEGLEDRGFKQSKNDPCLFISKDVICLVYVDDCLFFAKDGKKIDRVIERMKDEKEGHRGFDLNVEDDFAGFLGILINRKDDGTIELTQTGLINKILKIMGLENSREWSTPADIKPLSKDENGAPCSEPWSYASIVGLMMYLANSTRSDISYAVHNAARFTHCPRRSHEKALKRIARYLKATRTKGMIINPLRDLSLDLYADADFAGLWGSEHPEDPTLVKS